MIFRSCRDSRLALLLVGLTVFVFSSTATFAQESAARPDRGTMPGASYSVSGIENISLTNGNLNLSIPLASLPPIAGGKLKLSINAVYNSKLWNVTRAQHQLTPVGGCASWVVDTPQLSELGGWVISSGYRIVIRDAHEDFDYVAVNPPPSSSCEPNVTEQQMVQGSQSRPGLQIQSLEQADS